MMRKNILLPALFIILSGLSSSCQKEEVKNSRIDFENLPLEGSGVYFGSDNAGGFTAGNAFFSNQYDPDYHFWSGFSYTNHSDNSTRGYLNQYSAIAGHGADGSAKYAVLYTFQSDTITFLAPQTVSSIAVCNSTYAYYSMLEGDDFTDPFGGPGGDEKDFLHLIIKGINENEDVVSETWVVLADYTFEDNSLDMISNMWTQVELPGNKYLRYLVFSFESSDPYIPTYVCIDNIFGEMQD